MTITRDHVSPGDVEVASEEMVSSKQLLAIVRDRGDPEPVSES